MLKKENNIDISQLKARQVTKDDFKIFDLIVGLDEKNISDLNRSWINIIGYVTQETFLIDGTIKNNITFI